MGIIGILGEARLIPLWGRSKTKGSVTPNAPAGALRGVA